jgi:plastocyanin
VKDGRYSGFIDRRPILLGSALLPCIVAGVFLAFVAAPASGLTQTAAATIAVTAGKPTEYSFKLSATTVLTGSTVFRVVNGGKVAHSFTIAGQKTPVLKPGKSASLTVVFIDAGTYPYYSGVKGQSRMRGSLHVTEPPSPKSSSTTTVPVGVGEPTVAPADALCANPANTTVTVTLFDFSFSLSQRTIPCGMVTFNVTNTGPSAHIFDVEYTAPNGSHAFYGGKELLGNEKTTETITFTRTGTFQYRCDLHYDLGMTGSIAIT